MLDAGRRRDRGENPKAAELKKLFEEGVAASRASNHDVAIEKFNAAALVVPNCYDCYYNIGYAYLQKKDEKQAEAAWLKALELKPDYAEALNALATLYNNQKRFDEAAAMSAKAAAAGGAAAAAPTRSTTRASSSGTRARSPRPRPSSRRRSRPTRTTPKSNFQLGMALLNEGKLPEAIAVVREVPVSSRPTASSPRRRRRCSRS